jgi:hypothetical protein
MGVSPRDLRTSDTAAMTKAGETPAGPRRVDQLHTVANTARTSITAAAAGRRPCPSRSRRDGAGGWLSVSAMPPSSFGEIACGPDSEQERRLGSVGAGWHVDGGQHMTRQVEELDAELRRGDEASATWKEDN